MRLHPGEKMSSVFTWQIMINCLLIKQDGLKVLWMMSAGVLSPFYKLLVSKLAGWVQKVCVGEKLDFSIGPSSFQTTWKRQQVEKRTPLWCFSHQISLKSRFLTDSKLGHSPRVSATSDNKKVSFPNNICIPSGLKCLYKSTWVFS